MRGGRRGGLWSEEEIASSETGSERAQGRERSRGDPSASPGPRSPQGVSPPIDGTIRPERAQCDEETSGTQEERMHRFWNPDGMAARQLAPGVTARIASGEKVMLSLVTLAPGAVVPEHAHTHEQMGMLVSGSMELTVSGQTRTLS